MFFKKNIWGISIHASFTQLLPMLTRCRTGVKYQDQEIDITAIYRAYSDFTALTYTHLYIHECVFVSLEGDGTPLQYSCLENPRDGGAWWASIYGVAQSRRRLKRLSSSSSKHFYYKCSFMESLPQSLYISL